MKQTLLYIGLIFLITVVAIVIVRYQPEKNSGPPPGIEIFDTDRTTEMPLESDDKTNSESMDKDELPFDATSVDTVEKAQ